MPDASHDFGAHLRQAREQRGISLRAIADRTKISVLALEALERNDLSRLPGGIFTRAFVRAYAVEVGLDAEDTVRRFVARFPDACAEEVPRAYEPNPEHIEVDDSPTFGRAWRALAWSLPLLLGVGYFGFGGRLPLWRDAPQATAARPVDEHPAVPPPPAQRATVAIAPAPEAAAQPEAVAPAPRGDGAQAAASPGQPLSPSASSAVPALSQETQPPAATPAPAGGYRLTLAPREACWVSVRAEGGSVFSGLMRAGERKDLALQGPVSLTVGNAGAFDFFINEQPARSLGGPGQVVTAKLNTDNLKSFLDVR